MNSKKLIYINNVRKLIPHDRLEAINQAKALITQIEALLNTIEAKRYAEVEATVYVKQLLERYRLDLIKLTEEQ